MFYKVVFYHPKEGLEEILSSLALLGFGKIGQYDSWSVVTPAKERFRPLTDSKPAIGTEGELSSQDLFAVNLQCYESELEALTQKINELHPFEVPAIEAWALAVPTFPRPV
ncbi:MAG: hypothetical protein QNL04_03480 [SAR324 cluster bacterium]|nr:hypothetical protein [SAR324 cluster bacterium]